MLKYFTKIRQNGSKGFTLIELLVVIAIIGVLASIVLASLNNARKKARDARRITDIKQVQLALELYFDGQGSKYPAGTDPATTCTATLSRGLEVLQTNGYIPGIPKDPLSGTTPICYPYATPTGASPTTYHIGATLEDTNPALNSDKDCNSSLLNSCTTNPAYPFGFDGTPALVYDLIP